jgi:hypothetical protein
MLPWFGLDLKRDFRLEVLPSADDPERARIYERMLEAIRMKKKNEQARLERLGADEGIHPALAGRTDEDMTASFGIDILVHRLIRAEEIVMAADKCEPMELRRIFRCALWIYEMWRGRPDYFANAPIPKMKNYAETQRFWAAWHERGKKPMKPRNSGEGWLQTRLEQRLPSVVTITQLLRLSEGGDWRRAVGGMKIG